MTLIHWLFNPDVNWFARFFVWFAIGYTVAGIVIFIKEL